MFKEFLSALDAWDISVGSGVFILMAGIILVRIVLWLFGAVGVYRLYKAEQMENTAICFVPFLYHFSFGKIAENVSNEENRKTTKYSVWLLITTVLSTVLYIAFVISGMFSFTTITQFALESIELDTAMTIEMFKTAIYPIGFYFTALAVYICYFVLYRVAFWQILKIQEIKSPVVYMLISIFFPFLTPVLNFAISFKNNPSKNAPCEPMEIVE